MKKIDLKRWARRSHYEWFSAFADPTFSMNVRMDITALLTFCEHMRCSSFATVMYFVCTCLDEIPAFRLRTRAGEVVELDGANAAYTAMSNTGHFVNCRASLAVGYEAFVCEVRANQEKLEKDNYQQKQFNDISIVNDIYCSCVPWVDFLSVTQPIPDHVTDNMSIPRVCWGKYSYEENGTFMTLNLTANHALVDGQEMAEAFCSIQRAFSAPQAFLQRIDITSEKGEQT